MNEETRCSIHEVNDLAIQCKVNEGLISALWERTYKLLFSFARRYYNQNEGLFRRLGYELEDLYQQTYLALASAVRGYSIKKEYAFTTALYLYCKKEFRELAGLRSTKRDVQLSAVSVYEFINHSEGMQIIDAIEDETAAAEIEEIEQRLDRQRLAEDIQAAFKALDDEQTDVIKKLYYDNEKITHIARNKKMSVSKAQNIHRKALNKLRTTKHIAKYRRDIIEAKAWRHIGLKTFRRDGSSVELAILRLERDKLL